VLLLVAAGCSIRSLSGVSANRCAAQQQQQQQRFRAKQKYMVATLKTRLAELEDLVSRYISFSLYL
jgi:hypothetical protein